jgi:hypothetical protein
VCSAGGARLLRNLVDSLGEAMASASQRDNGGDSRTRRKETGSQDGNEEPPFPTCQAHQERVWRSRHTLTAPRSRHDRQASFAPEGGRSMAASQHAPTVTHAGYQAYNVNFMVPKCRVRRDRDMRMTRLTCQRLVLCPVSCRVRFQQMRGSLVVLRGFSVAEPPCSVGRSHSGIFGQSS